MLMRRIARPLLAAAFIGQGVEALRRPQQAGQTARPAFDGLQHLPDEITAKVPSDVETFAKANALVQIGGGLLLASGRLPRVAAAALACTVIPGSAGGHMFWMEPDLQRRAQQRQAFLTDVSLIGGLMIAAADTEESPRWAGGPGEPPGTPISARPPLCRACTPLPVMRCSRRSARS